MRLEWLDDILAILETDSLNAAADKRFVTQPAFSRRIKAIESHLGVEIVDRSKKPARIRATVGDQRKRIQDIAASMRDLQSDLKRQGREVLNRIVISSQHAITTSLAPDLVTRFSQDRHLSIRLRSANRDECYAQLLTKQADIALLYESDSEPLPEGDDYLETARLGFEPLVPVYPAAHLPRLNEDYARGEIYVVAYPSDVFLGKVVNQEILAGFANASFVRKRAETALTLAMKELALRGVGVAWLPKSLVHREIAAGILSDLSPTLPSARLSLVAMRLASPGPAAAERVWETIRAVVDRSDAFPGGMSSPDG